MGVSSNMALKAGLILATIGFVYSQSHCSAFEDGTNDGRDCSCADRSFGECFEPTTGAQLPVATLEECNSLCSDWSACAWFIFYQTATVHLNCRMFTTGPESMADYLSTCNSIGGPLRNEVDACLGDLQDVLCSDDRVCPGGCSLCAGDRCNDFAETGCAMRESANFASSATTNAFQCQTQMTTLPQAYDVDDVNYFNFDVISWDCDGYPNGRRSCARVVAAKNVDVQSC